MHPLLLLLPGLVCLALAVFAVLELAGAMAGDFRWRQLRPTLLLLALTAPATAIATIPPALWLAAWVIGGAP